VLPSLFLFVPSGQFSSDHSSPSSRADRSSKFVFVMARTMGSTRTRHTTGNANGDGTIRCPMLARVLRSRDVKVADAPSGQNYDHGEAKSRETGCLVAHVGQPPLVVVGKERLPLPAGARARRCITSLATTRPRRRAAEMRSFARHLPLCDVPQTGRALGRPREASDQCSFTTDAQPQPLRRRTILEVPFQRHSIHDGGTGRGVGGLSKGGCA
jgi:hypothetical protein